MKKTIQTIGYAILAGVISFSSLEAQTLKTPAPSPTQTLKQNFSLSEIGLEYSRPGVKGRVIFGDLVPFGKMWRTGANASTKITFGEDVKVEGKAVKAGTYAIYTVPNKDNWEIMLYSDLKLGGNVNGYDKSKEILRFTKNTSSLTEKVETFTIQVASISATSADIEFSWENTRVAFNVKTDIDSTIMATIDATVNTDNRPYYAAANYYYENGKDLKKALEWVNTAVAQNPNAYWVMMLKARIEYKLGDFAAAAASAEKVKTLASGKNDEYVGFAEAMLTEAKAKMPADTKKGKKSK